MFLLVIKDLKKIVHKMVIINTPAKVDIIKPQSSLYVFEMGS